MPAVCHTYVTVNSVRCYVAGVVPTEELIPVTTSPHPDLPVVVIGAGPVGLAAAAHLVERGLEPLVL